MLKKHLKQKRCVLQRFCINDEIDNIVNTIIANNGFAIFALNYSPNAIKAFTVFPFIVSIPLGIATVTGYLLFGSCFRIERPSI